MGIDAAIGLFAGLRRYAGGGPPMEFSARTAAAPAWISEGARRWS